MTNYEGIKMEADGDNIRFALLKSGKRMLYVFGVNPSTATESRSDSTMRKVIGFVERNGFDGFAMMNIYPLRSTYPNDLPKVVDEKLHQKNLTEIMKVIGIVDKPIILLAYGNSIDATPYLKECFKDIIAVLQPLCPEWKIIGNLTKKGNPRHPSRAAYSLKLNDVEVASLQ